MPITQNMQAKPLTVAITALIAWALAGALVLWPQGIEPPVLYDWRGRAVVYSLSVAIVLGLAVRRRGSERVAWLLLGLGTASWCAGDLYYMIALEGLDEIPFPNWSDLGYLAFIPFVAAGLFMRLLPHLRERTGPQLIDGLAAALSAGAVSSAIGLHAAMSGAEGNTWQLVITAAYPIGDAVLLGVLVANGALRDWRLSHASTILAVAFIGFWLSDTLYLVKIGNGTYNTPDIIDGGWALAVVLVAWAAERLAASGDSTPKSEAPVTRRIATPVVFAVASLAMLVFATFTEVHPVAVVLATLALVATLVRLTLSMAQNVRLVAITRHEATTDALTGLGNRRKLMTDLESALASGRPATLALFDLDGFKGYNDTFGHPAGDALLARLGDRVTDSLAREGVAYRIGGDEFCVLFTSEVSAATLARATAALSESGEGFSIGASHGAITLQKDAADTETAMRLVDQRMYARKHAGRASASSQSVDVLLSAVTARAPELRDHIREVAALAAQTARALGLDDDLVARVDKTAKLHDVGKVAIPDSILHKRDRLADDELAFLREHAIAGERIVSAAPALTTIAPLVRSLQERWDGSGYPDGLHGEQIPVEARIVAVADAFDTMITDRPHQSAMTPEEALEELRRDAGRGFDTAVVEAFATAYCSGRLDKIIAAS